ncbi:hypothetical protein HF086_001831 [Spodoptera exigua]|uniref:MADF domain-containing protein n=1 Tax=Spodoptera exigua TaxID=7107 RepID=A0A922MVV0_SPOEX|nr:hypothetical protein HF086_001831 [Spodoptera exigua]
MTMVDGKVCNAATGTKSTSRCYICGATSKTFNDLNRKDEMYIKAGPDMYHLPDPITVSVSSTRIMIAYVDGNLKQEAWDELSVEMECPVGELKKKMDYLLAALRREKSKIAKTSTSGKGADEVYQSSWFAFKFLQFLMDRNKPRPRINTEDQDRALKDNTSENEENDDIGEDHDQSQDKQPRSTASTESDQTTDNAKNSSKSQFKSPLPKKRKYVANQNPMLQSAFDLLKSSASAAKAVATASTAPASGLDQYQLYANYLASKFRGYSKQTYMTVEHHIYINKQHPI